MKINCILFDDGTLADTLQLVFKVLKTMFEKCNQKELSTPDIVSMFGPAEENIIRANKY